MKFRFAKAALAIGAVGAVLATAGCAGTSSAPASTAPVTITFSGWVTGIEGAVDAFNKSHTDVQVQFTRIASSSAKNLPSEIQANTAPDVAQLSISSLPSYVINKQVQDITSYVGDQSSAFTAAAWGGVTFGDKVYALPQDSAPNALMYRKDIFDKYGLTPPKTWDEYVADAQKLHAADPDLYIGQFSANEPGFWQVDQLQAGQSWFGTDGDAWTVDIDGSKTTPVAARYQKLLDAKLLKPEQMWTPEYWADINKGSIATINYAAWFPVLLEQNAPDLAGKWAVAPSPSDSGSGPSSDLGGSVNVVTKTSQHPQQAAEFIKWLNTDPASLSILIGKGGLFPAAIAGFDDAGLNKTDPYFGNQNISTVFSAAAKNVSDARVAGPQYDAAYSAVGDEFAKVATGQATISQALAAAAQTTRTAITQAGLTVK